MRSGTLNVPGIVGMGAACAICKQDMDSEGERLLGLRNRLENAITSQLETAVVNGHPTKRLPAHQQHLLPLRRGRIAHDGH